MTKINSLRELGPAMGYREKKKKVEKEKIRPCDQCSKFMHQIPNTNVLACDCGNTKLI